jgi:hypothetical protein
MYYQYCLLGPETPLFGQPLQNGGQTMFAVTISFVLGASVISGALYCLVLLGIDIEFARGVHDWIGHSTAVITAAAFSGLVVDAIRFLAARFWPGPLGAEFDLD